MFEGISVCVLIHQVNTVEHFFSPCTKECAFYVNTIPTFWYTFRLYIIAGRVHVHVHVLMLWCCSLQCRAVASKQSLCSLRRLLAESSLCYLAGPSML